jgi:DNA-directed RNA polymerase specialized sigma24 family protein
VGITQARGDVPKHDMLGRTDHSVKQPGRNSFEAQAMGHLDSLYATGLRMTRDPRDAEDLVQDTMLTA